MQGETPGQDPEPVRDEGDARPVDAEHAPVSEDAGDARAAPADPSRLTRLDAVLLIVVTLLSLSVHLVRLATPDRVLPADDEQCKKFPRLEAPCREQIPLDEWHYLPDARDVILYGTESDRRVPADDGAFVVHPPVGKQLIAFGIRLFGDSGFGWRFSNALLGSLAVAVLYMLARRLWGSPWLAATAGFLLGIEGLWFVMSRIAMLDISMSFFLLLGVWLLVEDRHRLQAWHGGPRWWRLGAGVAFGLALGSKWGAIPFYAVAIALAMSWELRSSFAARLVDDPGRARPRVPRPVSFAASLVLVPLAVYVASYVPWFLNDHRYHPPRCEKLDAAWLSDRTVVRQATGWVRRTGRVGQWLCYQREYLDFHVNLDKFEDVDSTETGAPKPIDDRTTEEKPSGARLKPSHPYFGDAWTWPWIGRPVAHYYESRRVGGRERIEHIVGLPNPVIWWSAFAIGIPLLAWWGMRRRDAVAILVLAFIAAGWVPYLYADVKDRPVFLFYALPMVPFLVLAVVHVMARAIRRFPGAVVVAVTYVAIAAVAFAYFYPVLSAYPLAREGWFGWSRRMWFYGPQLQLFGRYLLPGDCNAVDVLKRFCWI